MAHRLACLFFTSALAASMAPPVIAGTLPTGSTKFEPMVDEAAPAVRSFTVDGLGLIFQPAQPNPNAPDQEDKEHQPLTVYAAAMAAGLTPAIAAHSSYPPGTAPTYAVVKLNAKDRVPSLLIQSYTGGAHCCNDYIAITPVGDALKVVSIGYFNGGPVEEIPTDMDGDGRVEFAVRDDRFLYTFAPYYASWAPPMFLNVVDGKVEDVTTRPAYRQILEDYAAKALQSCADLSEALRNGACAAYVGVKARLGAYPQALKQVRALVNRQDTGFMPIGCEIETGAAACPEDKQVQFNRFEDAIAYHLKAIGYLN